VITDHCQFQTSINNHTTTHPPLTSLHLFLLIDDKDDILRRCTPHTHSKELPLHQKVYENATVNPSASIPVPQTSSAFTKETKESSPKAKGTTEAAPQPSDSKNRRRRNESMLRIRTHPKASPTPILHTTSLLLLLLPLPRIPPLKLVYRVIGIGFHIRVAPGW
jgi:hypothetical protein